MSEKLTEYQNNLIKSIAYVHGIKKYTLDIHAGSAKGDGALGIIKAVSIISSTRKLDLILKAAETNEEVRKQFPIRKAYLREMFLYENVFSVFDTFQKKKGFLDGFNGYAKLYGSLNEKNNESLLLENLKETGYTMWNRKLPMDASHLNLVVCEYAKFHAVSLAIGSKEPEVYRKLTKNMGDIFEDTLPKEEVISILKSIIRNNFKTITDTDSMIAQAFKEICVTAEKFCLEDLRCVEDQIVITHGDCWCNNMMFRYEDAHDIKKPTKVCLLDWQLSNLGSPVLDLSYFLFVCSSKEQLCDYKTYLKLYHDTLCSSLKKLSCDPNIFSFALFEHHWKKYAKFGFYTALMILKVVLGDAEEIPDLREVANSGKILGDRLNIDSTCNANYQQRILDIVYVMAENDLI